jgi:hypothetical protein
MLAYHDRASIEDVLESSLDARLRVLIARCIKQEIRPVTYDLIDFTSIVVARPGDTERAVRRALGFSPLTNVFDGARFGSAGFVPYWDVIHNHGGWFELIFTVGNDGFAFVLFVQDAEGVEPDLLTLCRTHAR